MKSARKITNGETTTTARIRPHSMSMVGTLTCRAIRHQSYYYANPKRLQMHLGILSLAHAGLLKW